MSDRHFDLLSLVTIFVFLVLFIGTSQEESNVGCLFSLDLCEPSEFCFDDNAFGRCQSRSDKSQGIKYSLDMETLQLLEQEMRRLYEAGYRWDHDYTQCLVRQILYTSSNKIVYNPGLCSRILSLSKPVMTPEIAMNLEKAMYPDDFALVQFSPNHKFIFAHETYFPSKLDSEKLHQHNIDKKVSLYLKDLLSRDLEENNEDGEVHEEQPDYDDNQSERSQRYLEFLLNQMSDLQNKQIVDRPESKGEHENDEPKADQTVDTHLEAKMKDKLEPREEKNESQGKLSYVPADGILPMTQDLEPILIDSLDSDNDQGSVGLETSSDLADLSFYRQHRYDIKKPGPSFFFHETDSSEVSSNEEQPNQKGPRLYYKKENQLISRFQDDSLKSSHNNNDNLDKNGQVSEKQVVEDKNQGDQSNEKTAEENPLYTMLDTNGHYEAVDGRHAFLTFEQNVKSLRDGEEYVKRLESLLGLSRGTLSNVRVQNNQITFKVNPNLAKLNASIIALKAYELKDLLKKETDLDLNSSGIGYKEKRGIKITADGLIKEESQQKLTFFTILSCFTVLVALVSGIVLFSIRYNLNLKQRLKNIIGNLGHHEEGIEATLDYEDLCRQQMQIANSKRSDTIDKASAKPNNPINMAKRSQNGKSVEAPPESLSPSRSSTSSWSEEPINSNLDISTGHMILNYMEEYLKNKDRLDKEWEALCAYEADPCSTVAALLPQNLNKNRFTDILPFDHSRVILNDLSNENRSDYINASTITDHDPRSPVYIVTQGPLPSTCASFWQMIWEQGSVIIVMLTRLMENGLALSARYWPEEGSQVYSSYEVTLVSEHIWCDDYLVRSFFLKNIRTNETRTVTQFHFLSWPENGVPTNPKSILDFRRKVNKSYRGGSCPIVVHCSDGIGRTGTYCLIDMVLNRLSKGAKEIDIAATLEHIRDQRGGSVKSKLQFKFVFTAIAEEVSAILKTLKP